MDPIIFDWKHVNVSVDNGKKNCLQFYQNVTSKLKILTNVSGRVGSGELVAIIGESGCGKTTLLAAISQRIPGPVDGEIRVNGRPVTRQEILKLSGFVPQYDITIDSLTVQEHLNFMLRMKGGTKEIVADLLDELGLKKCLGTKICCLSGGERKKLSLACELLTQPPILFCDEPTTGLDSYSALSIIRTLSCLTKNEKKVIVCSIHHPTSEVFDCFSNIILMNAGRIIYQGSKDDAMEFFKRIELECPQNYNPADFYVKNASSCTGTIFKKYQEEYVEKDFKDDHLNVVLLREEKRANWFTQIGLLLARSLRGNYRRLREYVTRTALFLITAITLTVMYLNIKPTTQTAIQDIRGGIFIISSEILFTIGYSVLYLFPEELPLLRREVGENMYSLSAYYVHCVILSIPKIVFETFLFIGVIYPFVQFFDDFNTYIKMATVCSAASIVSSAYGYLISSLFESTNMSVEVANIVYLFLMLLGGLYLSIRSFPYLKYLSVFFYANEGMSIHYWRNIKNIDCYDTLDFPCLKNGTEVLDYMGFGNEDSVIYRNYGFMAILLIGLHVISYFCVRRTLKKVGFY